VTTVASSFRMRGFLPLVALCSPLYSSVGGQGIPHISERQVRNGRLATSLSAQSGQEEVDDCKEEAMVGEEEYTVCSGNTSDSLHNYWSEDLEKSRNISLAEYKDNVLLVVNLASF